MCMGVMMRVLMYSMCGNKEYILLPELNVSVPSSRTCLEVEAAWPCFAMQLVRIIEADLDATCIQGLTSIKIPSLRLVCARYNCIVRYWRRLGHLRAHFS